MTPPDINGEQVFWVKEETGAGTLFLPEEPDKEAAQILVPENYRHEVGDDDSCIGFGSLPQRAGVGHFEAGYVHRVGDFALKSAPFRTQARLLDWLAANLMFRQAVLSLAKDGEERVGQKILGEYHKIVTPQYFGVLALDTLSGKSIVVMSDESSEGSAAPEPVLFDLLRWSLLDVTRNAMMSLYPNSNVNFDNSRKNWILDKKAKTLVRIDLFGTDLSVEPIHPTVRF